MALPTEPAARTVWPEESLVDDLGRDGPVLVALSGGVDSSLVASLAHEAAPREAWAVTLVGPAVPEDELRRATEVAARIGIRHEVVPVDPIADPEYRANPNNRCFFCRRTESAALRRAGERLGIRRFVDGVHVDDLTGERPGIAAMDAAGFDHPLSRAGWGKSLVRATARQRGLPNWDAPSNACLASRVAHGQTIDRELLRRIDDAEAAVRGLGFRQVRVRVDGGDARVEVGRGELLRLFSAPTARSVDEVVRRAGFATVALDPRGYRGADPEEVPR